MPLIEAGCSEAQARAAERQVEQIVDERLQANRTNRKELATKEDLQALELRLTKETHNALTKQTTIIVSAVIAAVVANALIMVSVLLAVVG